ncbi:hypothetical protein ACFU9Y_28925 [Streptomyces sp. NPDC057621]|uniref:hypothetical protein n=1 Tax=Streptomyces sp. NPDC057621 TaxID=3346186 RepID=UPI0036A8FEA2
MSADTEALSYLSGGNGMDIVQRWNDAQPTELSEPGAHSSPRARHGHPLWDAAQHHRNALADPHRAGAAHEASLKAVHDRVQSPLTPALITRELVSVWLPEPLGIHRSAVSPMPLVAPHTPARPLGALLSTLHPSTDPGPHPDPGPNNT